MFREIFDSYNWEEVRKAIEGKTAGDVAEALNKGRRGPDDFMALVSPAAQHYLAQMSELSHRLTLQRFGNTVQMYVPLYLSNECENICTYCGFSAQNHLRRKTLTDAEILQEAAAIKAFGFEHVLLVTGEAHLTVGVEYLKNAIRLLRGSFANISMEVQPLRRREYEELIAEGLSTVLVYQETYHSGNYQAHHLRGKKSNFYYRLDTADRLGMAGIHKMGLGVLLGLEDWRTDSFFTALHLRYLEKAYWQTRYTLSFPRLRPAEGVAPPRVELRDRDLAQLICAYRIFDQEVELSLSTRESEHFRDHIIKLGITSMSAGSKTNPGGYAAAPASLEQFAVSDERSPAAIAAMLRRQGYEPVWKDWDPALMSTAYAH